MDVMYQMKCLNSVWSLQPPAGENLKQLHIFVVAPRFIAASLLKDTFSIPNGLGELRLGDSADWH